MNERETSELAELLGAYLHQDYDLEYGTVEAAISAYRDASTGEQRAALLREIDALLDAYGDDDELTRALRPLGFSFHPPRDGETTGAWLRRARRIVAS